MGLLGVVMVLSRLKSVLQVDWYFCGRALYCLAGDFHYDQRREVFNA
jgi:hypothetical protein